MIDVQFVISRKTCNLPSSVVSSIKNILLFYVYLGRSGRHCPKTLGINSSSWMLNENGQLSSYTDPFKDIHH